MNKINITLRGHASHKKERDGLTLKQAVLFVLGVLGVMLIGWLSVTMMFSLGRVV